jgi:4-amino-4-deoxy-L-arabinose transferase-like glycosyltransferase
MGLIDPRRTRINTNKTNALFVFIRVLRGWFFVFFLCGFLFFYGLGDRPLTSSHEARAAQNAASILSEDDWLLPQLFDRQVELQKPPLYYWLAAGIAQLFGIPVGGWAVRLPAALAALGTVLAVYLFGWLRGRSLAGFVAAAILATCCHFTWLARVGRIDMPLTFTTTLVVIGWNQGVRSGRTWPWLLLAYLALAAGLLLKGPIAVVLPGVIGLLFLVLNKLAAHPLPLAPRPSFGLWWGIPLVLLLAGSWYLLAGLETHGDFLRVFFWHHNFDRGLAVDGELHSRPWWFYGPRMLADLFPWSLILPAALWLFWRRGRWRDDPLARLGLVWLGGILVLLSLMSFKRADYLLPAYPGAALFLGAVVERWWQDRSGTARMRWAWGFFLILAVCAASWGFYAGRVSDDSAVRFAEAIRARTDRPVVFFRVEDHELAFHVGRPVDSLVEWENLDAWLARGARFAVLMPAESAAKRDRYLKHGRLEEVLRDRHWPLVLLRPADSLMASGQR